MKFRFYSFLWNYFVIFYFTPLFVAVKIECVKIVEILLEHPKIDVNMISI